MNTTKINSEADIWLRTMLPETGRISLQDAETILRLRLSPRDRARADALGQKANAGTLTAEEEAELDHYLTVGRSLELMKAKAKLAWRETGASE